MSGEPISQDDSNRPQAASAPPTPNLLPSPLLPSPQFKLEISYEPDTVHSPLPDAASIASGQGSPRASPVKVVVRENRPGSGRQSRKSSLSYIFSREKTTLPAEFRPHPINQWKSPLLMLVFFALGLGMSIGHVVYYVKLAGVIVGDEYNQESNIRVGTAFAFLSQIFLSACVWLAYTQWLWRSIKDTGMTPRGLNAAFGADTSVLSLLNPEMLKKFTIGWFIAFFAWSLLLPPFFTPATLFIVPSTAELQSQEMVPRLAIWNSSEGNRFAYSPPTKRNTVRYQDDGSRVFTGPRTILSLLSTATASLGEILPIKAPHNHSSYDLEFPGPIVKCEDANATTSALIDAFLAEKMREQIGTARATKNAYYAFVPVYDNNGSLTAVDQPRNQAPSNGTNLLWMTFTRYILDANGKKTEARQQFRQACTLYNATYSLHLSWDHGFQEVTGTTTLLNEVAFPVTDPDAISDMSQHAYAAVMWVLADQLVGSLSWYEEPQGGDEGNATAAAQFGVIDSRIQHNSLLGSDDLDPFFDFARGLYAFDSSENGRWSDQRLQDKNLARNRTLAELVEELSFNTTISLLHNELLTKSIPANVLRVDDVNRYGYLTFGLIVPYALANFFTLVVVILGCVSYWRHDVLPGRAFSDIAMASRDPEIVAALRERRGSLKVVVEKGEPIFRSGSLAVMSGGSDGGRGTEQG